MDFYALEAFLKLSENLHFTKTAGLVNLSPSALSRVIQGLEEEWGKRFFERDNRGVSLTDEGKIFRGFAQDVLSRRNQLSGELSEDEGVLRGDIRIFASVTACYALLPPFIEKLTMNYPFLKVNIVTGDPAHAIEALKSDEVDLALAALPDKEISGYEVFEITKSPLVFVGRQDALNRNLVEDSVKALIQSQPLLLPERGIARERFEQFVEELGISYVLGAEAQGNEALFAMARLGLGLALVPLIVFENGPFAQGLEVFHLGDFLGNYRIGYVQKIKAAKFGISEKLKKVLRELLLSTATR